jgi:hypothetical protein
MSFKVPEQHMLSNIHAITKHAEVQAHFSKTRGNAQPQNTQQNCFEYCNKMNIKCAQTILPHKMGQCISVSTAYQQMADYINFGQRTTLNH